MAFETKGILISICGYILEVKDDSNAVEKIYEFVRKMATADSPDVVPFNEAK